MLIFEFLNSYWLKRYREFKCDRSFQLNKDLEPTLVCAKMVK